ncbi:MAG: NAD(+)/NADH kinase [bacterium]
MDITSQRIGVVGNSTKPGAAMRVAELLELLHTKSNAKPLVLSELALILNSPIGYDLVESQLDVATESDVIFSFGGDGTMLTAARAIITANPNAELIGINLGKLGFIAENPPEEIPAILDDLWNGNLRLEERLLIGARVSSEKDSASGTEIRRDDLRPSSVGEKADLVELIALNEIVVDNFGSTRMLTFEIIVEGSSLGTIRADGLIVASPTGSTGYAASAGGPIVEPTSRVIIITPIAPHSLTVRPVIIPEGYEISLRITNEAETPTLIVADGQQEIIVTSPALVRLSGHSKKLKLLRRKTNSYFDLLRTKLLWSADAREGRR